jgi:hypothetical protein
MYFTGIMRNLSVIVLEYRAIQRVLFPWGKSQGIGILRLLRFFGSIAATQELRGQLA